jgi:KDO2-lipid IV(A) lauroyltransferase
VFRAALRWARGKDSVRTDRAGNRLGRLLHRCSAKHRNRALSNLKLAFPEWTDERRAEVALRVFEHFGASLLDFLRAESRSGSDCLKGVEIEGLEHLREALDQGKGLLLIGAHFGNWERLPSILRSQGIELYVVARGSNDPKLDELVARLREASGVSVLPRGNAARAILKALRENKAVGLLPDQNGFETFVTFFGKPAGTTLGPAVMHLRSGAPLVPVYCARLGTDRFRVWAEAPLKPVDGMQDVQDALTQAVNDSIERAIRAYPDQWLWFHDRWKSARERGLL